MLQTNAFSSASPTPRTSSPLAHGQNQQKASALLGADPIGRAAASGRRSHGAGPAGAGARGCSVPLSSIGLP
eukprot:8590510-Pyramimonas_sp.AAC.1